MGTIDIPAVAPDEPRLEPQDARHVAETIRSTTGWQASDYVPRLPDGGWGDGRIIGVARDDWAMIVWLRTATDVRAWLDHVAP